jgi:hypothetical protein
VTHLDDLSQYLHDHVFLTAITILSSYVGRPAPLVLRSKGVLSCLDGILLGATFKITRHAVALIPILSICNIGIPLALSFRRKLGQYRVVSDQSRTLRIMGIRHRNRRFVCLRYLLVALKLQRLNDEVGQLVRFRIQSDEHRLCSFHPPGFAASEEPDAGLFSWTLTNFGLGFVEVSDTRPDPTENCFDHHKMILSAGEHRSHS